MTISKRKRGRRSKLTEAQRKLIETRLREGATYEAIRLELAQMGILISRVSIGNINNR
jgi:transposase